MGCLAQVAEHSNIDAITLITKIRAHQIGLYNVGRIIARRVVADQKFDTIDRFGIKALPVF